MPFVTANPSDPTLGQTVVFRVQAFSASAAVTIELYDATPKFLFKIGDVRADSAGNGTLSWITQNVKENTTYMIKAYNAAKASTEYAWTQIDVKAGTPPSISLSVSSGAPNTSVNISVKGFAPNETVNITFGTSQWTSIAVDSLGSGSKTGVAVPNVTPSSYIVTARGATSSKTATTTFTVTSSSPTPSPTPTTASMTITPSIVYPGDSFDVQVQNYAAGERVNVKRRNPDGTETSTLFSITVDSNGAGSITRSVPKPLTMTFGAGTYEYIGTGATSGRVASAKLTVRDNTNATVSISPSSVVEGSGTLITVNVTGYYQSEPVYVYYSSSTIAETLMTVITAGTNGAGSISLEAPRTLKAGVYTIKSKGSKSAKEAITSLTITAPSSSPPAPTPTPTPAPTPTSPQQGDVTIALSAGGASTTTNPNAIKIAGSATNNRADINIDGKIEISIIDISGIVLDSYSQNLPLNANETKTFTIVTAKTFAAGTYTVRARYTALVNNNTIVLGSALATATITQQQPPPPSQQQQQQQQQLGSIIDFIKNNIMLIVAIAIVIIIFFFALKKR